MFQDPYPAMEPIVVALFAAMALYLARTEGRWALLVLLSAAVYGVLLEEGDQLIFRSYHYSSGFILTVDRVPFTIALCWALIIVTGMRMTDAYGIPQRWAPFADAFWAIILDLSLDAIAIRLGFWEWDIRPDQGLFGVPAGNFYAWIVVAASFSYFTRRFRNGRRAKLQMATPFLAYVGLLGGMIPFIALRAAFFPGEGRGFPLFWTAFAACIAIAIGGMARAGFRPVRRYPPFFTAVRLLFHAFFLSALVAEDMAREAPGLAVLALAMVGIELVLAAALHLRRPPAPAEATVQHP
ncbi:MAG: carotenoid biosynthesis protein [Dehalococcoidia bacterium]|nr:carotenoid biosynthesis protein [Dehalococcoidia bacterium]